VKISKPIKITGIILTVIITFIIIVIIFISPIAKYLIEKYSVKYTGRQIRMSWLYLNPFTGYIHMSHLKIYEYKSDSIFFKADGLSVNFAMLKLPKKTYEIESVTLTNPWGIIIQNRKAFNFDDLIQKFSPDTTKPKPVSKGPPVHFNLLKVKIKGGEFHYIEQNIPVNYFIKDFNFESPGWRWNVDTILGKVSLVSGPSAGGIKAGITFNIKTLGYRAAVVINKFDLGIIQQYLHGFASYGAFRANLDADVKASGNFTDQLAVIASGRIALNDFHFGKTPDNDFASFSKLIIQMTEVNPKNYKYIIDSICLRSPFFKYERYDYLDNVENMFGKGGANYKAAKADSTKFNLIIQIADYINVLAKNFLQSYYKIGRVAIYDGDIRYNDYAIREKFSIDAYPLYIAADNIDKNHKRLDLTLKTGVKPFGSLGVEVSIDPNNYGEFDILYHLHDISVASFNPYIITYTSFPLDRGTLEFNGKWTVHNSQIQSNNHLLILDPRVSKRENKKDTKWIPVPLIMSLVRSAGNAIDFDIPIRGNLKDPKFKVWKAIGQVVENIFVKPPTTPYLIDVKEQNNKVEKYLTLKWPMRSNELKYGQKEFLEKIAGFLKNTPAASITVDPLEYTDKEKEYILLFDARKKYFQVTHNIHGHISENDSIAIDKMSVKDSSFVHFLNKQTDDKLLFTVQDKAARVISQNEVNADYAALLKERDKIFMAPFTAAGVQAQVKMHPSEKTIPYDGFSYYKIDYKGELPRQLQAAYQDMDDLNETKPRAKYDKERKKVDGGVIIEEKGK
jgi:hypothetical protein